MAFVALMAAQIFQIGGGLHPAPIAPALRVVPFFGTYMQHDFRAAWLVRVLNAI